MQPGDGMGCPMTGITGGDLMMGGGMTWMMWLFWIPILVLIVGLVVLVVVLLGRRPGGAVQSHSAASETPMEILKRRLASGEIDSDQFRQMKRDLGEGSRTRKKF